MRRGALESLCGEFILKEALERYRAGGPVDLEMVQVRAMAAADAREVAELAGQLGYARTEREVHAWMMGCAGVGREQAAFVACREEEVVGWVEVSLVHHLQSAAHGLIGGLVVKEGVRGLGIGWRLRDRAETWVWERGADLVVVTSRSTRLDAHRFYLRDGYTPVKTSEVFSKARPG